MLLLVVDHFIAIAVSDLAEMQTLRFQGIPKLRLIAVAIELLDYFIETRLIHEREIVYSFVWNMAIADFVSTISVGPSVAPASFLLLIIFIHSVCLLGACLYFHHFISLLRLICLRVSANFG